MKKILYAVLILGLIAAGIAYWAYGSIFNPNTSFSEEQVELKIPSNSSYSDVYDLLESSNILKDLSSFDQVAGWMKYKKEHVPGADFKRTRCRFYNII